MYLFFSLFLSISFSFRSLCIQGIAEFLYVSFCISFIYLICLFMSCFHFKFKVYKVYKYLLKVNEMHRMEAPYKSNCMKSWDISGYNMSVNYAFSVFNETLRVLYIPTSFSFQLCKSNCHKQAIITNCNCSWPELFIPNSGRYFYFAHIFSFYTFRA